MHTFDNGNPHPVSLGDRNTPRLDGDKYCSLACGCGCTKAAFDEASERARSIAAQLGKGWEPKVWENCGWHFSVGKGIASVSLDENGRYVGVFIFEMSETNRVWMEEVGTDPREVITALSAQLQERIAILKRAIMSVSIEPLEINSTPETAYIDR